MWGCRTMAGAGEQGAGHSPVTPVFRELEHLDINSELGPCRLRVSLKQCMYLVVSLKPSFKLALSGLVLYSAACGATLSGLVQDQTGVGIPRAHISIRSHEERVGLSFASRADARGEFRFKDIPPGSYDIA